MNPLQIATLSELLNQIQRSEGLILIYSVKVSRAPNFKQKSVFKVRRVESRELPAAEQAEVFVI